MLVPGLSSTREYLMTFVLIYTVLFSVRKISIYEFCTLRSTDCRYFVFKHLASYDGINAIKICLIYIEKMPNKKKLDFDVKRYLVAEVLYPDHVVPLHVGECKYRSKYMYYILFHVMPK